MRTYDGRIFSEDTLILFHGGGNFGDLWPNYGEFRRNIISRHHDNKIIILPQSVYYKSEDNLRQDVEVYGKCKSLTICARDQVSYDFLKRHFNNKILLLPDMAFWMDLEPQAIKEGTTSKTLLLFRKDVEAKQIVNDKNIPDDAVIREWPTFEKMPFPHKAAGKLNGLFCYLKHPLGKKREYQILDKIWQSYVLPYNIRKGIEFVKKFDCVYSTRLHGAILSILLGKEVYMLDNSYGKISAFYETWLQDLDSAHLLK